MYGMITAAAADWTDNGRRLGPRMCTDAVTVE